MTMLEIFDRFELTWLGTVIRESLWLFPTIEAVHLLGLALLGGSVLVVDLRLWGRGLSNVSIEQVVRQTTPWLVGAIVTLFVTGIPMFLSEAIKCYYNTSFWVKISALCLALLFTFAIRNPLALSAKGVQPWSAKLLATVSQSLWFTVAAAGRWIGFS